MSKRAKPTIEGRESRVLPFTGVELRVETRDGKNVLTGLTAPFGKLSLDLGGFQEQIEPGAFREALKRSDPVALFNHEQSNLLGRVSAGTLRVKETDAGLEYDVDLPATPAGETVRVGVERGDIRGNSFAFRVKKDAWEERADGTWLRTVMEVEELFDVGPVVNPAYPDTEVALRSMEAMRAMKMPVRDESRERLQKIADVEV